MGMRFWALTKKEFASAWLKGLICLAIALATGISLPYAFEWLGKLYLPGNLPGGLRQALDAQLQNYTLFLWSNWYGKNLLQYMLVFALIFGAPSIASEAATGSIGYTLSRPLSRKQILGTKFLASGLWLSLIAVISTLGLGVATWLYHQPVGWGLILRGLPGTLAGTLLALSISFAFSAVVDDSIKAAIFTLAVLAALGWPAFVPGWARFSYLTYMAAAGPFSVPAWVWWGTGAVAAGVVAVYLLALKLFTSRDY